MNCVIVLSSDQGETAEELGRDSEYRKISRPRRVEAGQSGLIALGSGQIPDCSGPSALVAVPIAAQNV
jgi:hypothetical protein